MQRQTPISLTVLAFLPVALLIGCRENAPDDIIQTEKTTEALVFVKTTTAETLNRNWADGNLYKLSPIAPDGEITPITNFTGASVSDPCVSFDGERILFSMRAPGENFRNIYEIGADGSGLTQITSGGGHDFDPLYLPDGRILFTSSRDGEMDEYNHARAEHLHACDADGGNLERISFNQSDDFDPALLPDGRILYTRWEHFGTMNRFPLFFTNPDGTGTFHLFGPHNQNFFHPQPTPDGRLVAIGSTEIEGDAGPIVVLKLEEGPADPVQSGYSQHWDVLTAEVNMDGSPWAYGAFKYPFSLGKNRYVASYTLPAAEEDETDYALYTFTLRQEGAGTPEDPARILLEDLTFLYNDPVTNELDAALIAPHAKPPVIASTVDRTQTTGIFVAQDVFNRGTQDGQEVPQKGIDPIDQIAVIAGRPTKIGEPNDFSANEFEKRALLGFAPVQPDGSFKIRVPADTPIAFATLDELTRGFVVKRTWLYVRPGEEFTQCVGCHEDRAAGGPRPTNPAPMAMQSEAADFAMTPEEYTIINFRDNIGPIVQRKCTPCHVPTLVQRDTTMVPDGRFGGFPDSLIVALVDTIPPPGNLNLSFEPDTTNMEMDAVFPIAYTSLSGESMNEENVVVPAFPRRSVLVDYVLGVGVREGLGSHPENGVRLSENDKFLFNLWVLLGAQYR